MVHSTSNTPDYSALIDDEVWAFIRKTEQFYPDGTSQRGINEQRSFYDELCHAFSREMPANVSISDDLVIGDDYQIPVRRYSPVNSGSEAIIVYMHGGGFVVGGLNSHDAVCAELCDRTGCKFTAVDYRLSPEHKHPAAFDDCLQCVQYEASKNRVPIILCGDSAGGNLAAAVAHRLSAPDAGAGQVNLAGQVLIYPELGGDTSKGSYVYHANAPMLSTADMLFYLRVRVSGTLPKHDPTFAPLQAQNFAHLPDTTVVSAECDPLSYDGKHYCEAIVQAGGKANWINEPGLVHGFLRARHSSKQASASFDRIVAALERLATA